MNTCKETHKYEQQHRYNWGVDMEGATTNRLSSPYLPLLALIILYVALVFGLPPDPVTLDRLDISATELRLLTATVTLPLIAIWFAAFYGYVHFADYARTIRKSPEGRSYAKLATGLGILAYGLPISAITDSALDYIAQLNPGFIPASTIIDNYVSIIIVLAGFLVIYAGAKSLVTTVPRVFSSPLYISFLAGFIALAVGYVYLVLTNPLRTHSTDVSNPAIYHLPDWLIIPTIILPYLLTWFIGLWAAQYIYHYHKIVKGIIYKSSFLYLSVGLSAVILGSILLQYISAVRNLLLDLALAPLLLVVYAILIAISIGYVLVALGAKKLQKIEEV